VWIALESHPHTAPPLLQHERAGSYRMCAKEKTGPKELLPRHDSDSGDGGYCREVGGFQPELKGMGVGRCQTCDMKWFKVTFRGWNLAALPPFLYLAESGLSEFGASLNVSVKGGRGRDSRWIAAALKSEHNIVGGQFPSVGEAHPFPQAEGVRERIRGHVRQPLRQHGNKLSARIQFEERVEHQKRQGGSVVRWELQGIE
jgi:hypothetical protein